MRAFNVYLNGKKIDTVFYGDSTCVDREEVKRSLINHDGYDNGITVREDHTNGTGKSRGYVRTTHDEFVTQTYTGGQCGWEDVTVDDNRKDARQMLQDYRENQPEFSHRVIVRRVKNKNEGVAP